MKHFIKKSAAVVLSAVLLVGSIGFVPDTTIATAATSKEDAMAVLEKIGTATSAVSSIKTVKTESTVELDFPLLGQVKLMFETIIDRNTGTVKVTAPAVDLNDPASLTSGSLPTSTSYTDLKSNILYSYSKALERYEIHEIQPGGSIGLIPLYSKDKIGKLADYITFGDITTSTVEGKELSALPITLKLGKDDIDKLGSDLDSFFPAIASIQNVEITDTDIVITAYFDSNYLIAQTSVTGTITAKREGSSLEVKVNSKNTNSLLDESLTIPDEVINEAQLAEGYVGKVSGVKITTVISGKNTQFSVFDVTKKKAKKLTIPASINVYGRKYNICTAHGKAFKKAKKLKTLVVKNKSLKKLLKKNPVKYGLKKSVKIK